MCIIMALTGLIIIIALQQLYIYLGVLHYTNATDSIHGINWLHR